MELIYFHDTHEDVFINKAKEKATYNEDPFLTAEIIF
jgi:hypothetical protein